MLGWRLTRRRSLVLLGLILLLGAGLRLALFAHAPVFLVPRDSPSFFDAGYSLVQSGSFDLPAKRSPLYPLFLAGVIRVFGWELEKAALAQHALGLGTIGLTYLLGTLAFGRPAGLLAALLVAVDGALLLLEQSILSETLYAPLLTACLIVVLLALRQGRWPGLLLAGLLLGLATLTRPVTQAILPLVLLAVLLAVPGRRARLVGLAAVCLGYGLIVTPWVVRNQIVNGTPAVSSGLGDALFKRVHYYDREFEFRDYGPPPGEAREAQIRARIFELAPKHRLGPDLRTSLIREFGLSDAESDLALRNATLQVVRQEPGRFLQGTGFFFVELGLFYRDPFGPYWRSRLEQNYGQAWPERVRAALEDAPARTDSDQEVVARLANLYQDRQWGLLVGGLFLLGTFGCLAAGRRRGLYLLPAIVVAQLLLYVALDGLQVRYRTPLQPLIAVVNCGGLLLVVGWARTVWSARERRSLRSLLPGRRLARSR